MQSVEEDIIDDDSIDDELSCAKPGTTAEAIEPAASRTAITAISFFMTGLSREQRPRYKIPVEYFGLYFKLAADEVHFGNEAAPATFGARPNHCAWSARRPTEGRIADLMQGTRRGQ